MLFEKCKSKQFFWNYFLRKQCGFGRGYNISTFAGVFSGYSKRLMVSANLNYAYLPNRKLRMRINSWYCDWLKVVFGVATTRIYFRTTIIAFAFNAKCFVVAFVYLVLLFLTSIFGKTGHMFLLMFLQIVFQDPYEQY